MLPITRAALQFIIYTTVHNKKNVASRDITTSTSACHVHLWRQNVRWICKNDPDKEKSFDFQFLNKDVFYSFYSYNPESSPKIIDNT